VHYALVVPADVIAPITVSLKLKYRKFDKQFTDFMARSMRPGDKPLRGHRAGQPYLNEFPIMVLAEDRLTFPVEGIDQPVENASREIAAWERWNDYGIGLFLKGKAELRQAADAFARVESLGQYHGPLNSARVLHREGRLDEAVDAIERAAAFEDPPAPPWTMAWLSGLVNREQGYLPEAAANFRSVLETRIPDRDFDFSLDFEIINLLGMTLFDQANQQIGPARREAREELLKQAVEQFEQTLKIDSENVTAHYNLALLYARLDKEELAEEHRQAHARYKPDDNAGDHAATIARQEHPAADHAAESLVIYSLHRTGETPNTETKP
jgi:tetratricopeptide (TPR) repeat protein